MDHKNKILILFAHPAFHKSKVNKQLINTIKNIEGITLRNLYEIYPDFFINVQEEQELLVQHDIIAWHHPFYWYSAPPLLKEWIDLVLEHNFAYGSKGTALKGKRLFSILTTGGGQTAYGEQGYNIYTINELLAPFRQTARLCNMIYFPPFVVHGTHLLSHNDILSYAKKLKSTLILLRDDIFDENEIKKLQYLNELTSQ